MAEFKSWKDHYWHGVPVMKQRIEKILEYADCKDERVLECGCNEGFVSKALQEAGGFVTSTDTDPSMRQKAKELFGLNVEDADVNDMPYSTGAFDVVVAGELLEHTSNPFKALTELFRVAEKRVIITIPVGEYWLGEVTHVWELKGCFINHDVVQVYDGIKDILVLCFNRKRTDGFKDIPPFDTAKHKERFKIQ